LTCTKEDKEPLATFDWEPYTIKRIKEEVDMEEEKENNFIIFFYFYKLF